MVTKVIQMLILNLDHGCLLHMLDPDHYNHHHHHQQHHGEQGDPHVDHGGLPPLLDHHHHPPHHHNQQHHGDQGDPHADLDHGGLLHVLDPHPHLQPAGSLRTDGPGNALSGSLISDFLAKNKLNILTDLEEQVF